MTVAPWPDETELAEARAELGRLRRALLTSERADLEGRVANRGLWRASLRRNRERAEQLERLVETLAEHTEGETA